MADLFDSLTRCRTHIEAALEYSHGTHTFVDIAAGVLSGRYQLWAGKKSAVVTEIIVYPRQRDLHYFLAGGDLDELKTMRPHIEAWAIKQGCSSVTLAGRPGWAKTFLRDEGYEPSWFILKKDLRNE
jgi:hypothetical protein